uniref:hypothetical protein n=1 Tax=Pseudocitrobacter faecalis TaxID=1398493 RepID=UPI003BA29CCE
VRQRFLPDAALPYPAYGLVLLFVGCGVNALSGLRFGAVVGRISAAHPASIHAGLNGCGLRAKPGGERFGGAGEQGGVDADGDKQRA